MRHLPLPNTITYLLTTLTLLLPFQPPSTASAAALLPTRQYEDGSYTACAQTCFEPAVDATHCPFDASGTRNACLCPDTSFWTAFMTCTFRACAGEVLAQTAQTAVGNCNGTGTPSVWSVDMLLSVGQGEVGGGASSSSSVGAGPLTVLGSTGVSSVASVTFVSSPSVTPAASSVTSTSLQPSQNPTLSPGSPITTPSSTTSNAPSSSSTNPSSSPSDPSSSPSSGLNTAAIIGIVIGGLSAVSAIIFGIRQWRTRPPGDRAVRDVGSWFCGCGRHRRYDETPMMPNPRRNHGYR